jgi:hypothetical protein
MVETGCGARTESLTVLNRSQLDRSDPSRTPVTARNKITLLTDVSVPPTVPTGRVSLDFFEVLTGLHFEIDRGKGYF